MYRFVLRPVWLLSHVFAITLVVLFVNLGFWQLRRHDEKVERNATITARSEEADGADRGDPARTGDRRPTAAPVPAGVRRGDLHHRPDVLIDNRSNDGLPGAWIVTPLRLEDGTVLAVSRGFQRFDSGVIDPPPPPAGLVEVVGTVLPWDQRECGIRTDDRARPSGRRACAATRSRARWVSPCSRSRLQRISSSPPDADVLVPVPLPGAEPRSPPQLRGPVVHLRHHRPRRVSPDPAPGGPGEGRRHRARRRSGCAPTEL